MRRTILVLALAAVGLMPMPATAQTAPTCFGQHPTFLGTPDVDRFRGTNGIDVMHGLGGGDFLNGLRGGDLLCGGGGDDFMVGEYNGDKMDGGAGADALTSAEGNDLVLGGDGDDYLTSRGGEDLLYGGPGNDRLGLTMEQPGDLHNHDVVHGGTGNDRLGHQGDWGGTDYFYGDDGDDVIFSTAGSSGGNEPPGNADRVDGGAGYDVCEVDPDDRVLNCEEITILDEDWQ